MAEFRKLTVHDAGGRTVHINLDNVIYIEKKSDATTIILVGGGVFHVDGTPEQILAQPIDPRI
jgi:hypothetical protein